MAVDIAAMNVVLNCLLGTGDGASAPAHMQLALFTEDPRAVDNWATVEVETTNGDAEATGYARVQINPSGWAAASNGEKTTTGPTSFPNPTAAWDLPATHVGLIGADGYLYPFVQELAAPIVVTGPGTWADPVAVVVSVADSLEPEGDED